MDFKEDAIVLSGTTGTKLKCEILGKYYPTWWGITSGGEGRENRLPTSIVELNAGTGEDYVEETRETILGSSGHALQLKHENNAASKLKVLLVEENQECFNHLKKVIHRRWPAFETAIAEGLPEANTTNVYLLHKSLDDAIATIESISLGNSLFFFDPLLYTPWTEIERVARKRIKFHYQTRTEFIVFLFTSDWFMGRMKLGLTPLPHDCHEASWTREEHEAVSRMDDLFAERSWRESILTGDPIDARIEKLVALYRERLHKWFRYVLPMPFKPRREQLYHLFMCSNYEVGITLTKGFYARYTNNSPYSPDNAMAYSRFKQLHPTEVEGYVGNRRPIAWRILWTIIRNHDEGLCDIRCDDLREIEENWQARLGALQWLQISGYLKKSERMTDAWDDNIPIYKLDWEIVHRELGVQVPKPFLPMEPKT